MAPPEESGQYFRESTRAPLRSQVTLQVDAFKDPEPAHTGNLSLGGMFVELEKPVPVGTIVKFELDLESSPTTVRGTAEVVWIRIERVAAEKPAGVGLQFRHFEGDGKALVRGAVEEVLEAQGLSVESATVVRPKPRARPRRPRPKSAASRPAAPSPRESAPKKRRKKEAPKSAKSEASPAEDRKKLIAAIILILILMYVLSRALS
ncbi:MAG: PilZ domain-containing protein [Acidobacteriota bacterium]